MHLHLISDSTGDTVEHVARASLVQFGEVNIEEHLWCMVRSDQQVEDILKIIKLKPGFVLYTLVSSHIQESLEKGCKELKIPCVSILQPIIDNLRLYLGQEGMPRPGAQHVLNAEYFDRIEAMDFVMAHDDGQSVQSLDEADVILIGASRTSKTPTCIYLGNKGIKAANIPLVPNVEIPPEVLATERPLIVGITKDPRRLVEIRRQRLKFLKQDENTDYVDLDVVSKEINDARRLFTQHGWPVINVSRKSIEETSALIIQLYHKRAESHAET